MIFDFALDNSWMSSFYSEKPFTYKDVEFRSVVQAYEYNKCLHEEDAKHILTLMSYDSHKYGQTVLRKPAWDLSKYTVLLEILYERFKDEGLRAKLLDTGHDVLLAGYSNDKFGEWCYHLYEHHDSCMDANYYGKMLMYLRFMLQTQSKPHTVSKKLIDTVVPNTVAKKDLAIAQEVCDVFNKRIVQ